MSLVNRYRNAQTESTRGVFLILTAFFIFSVQDVIVKIMSSDYALLQIVVIRTLFSIPTVLLIVRYNGNFSILKSKTLALQYLRGGMMFVAYIFFFMALVGRVDWLWWGDDCDPAGSSEL